MEMSLFLWLGLKGGGIKDGYVVMNHAIYVVNVANSSVLSLQPQH